MSRNQEFFHGSSHHFGVGDLVDPSMDTWGSGESHATNDQEYARAFGERVYRVEPVGEVRDLSPKNATVRHYTSKGGYRVIEEVQR